MNLKPVQPQVFTGPPRDQTGGFTAEFGNAGCTMGIALAVKRQKMKKPFGLSLRAFSRRQRMINV